MKFTKCMAISLALLCSLPSFAKNPIPHDPEVIIDTLPNGLTYYIRHNESPKGMADFFIAQKVGSVNEEDNQRGLAHFLEHMCFNGTEHFPGNSLISYLEGLGVKFGANLNAYTSTDETVYNICQVPTTRTSALDSCLLILRDWSCGLTLDPTEIDKERGVIKGEWRQRNGSPNTRLLEKSLPALYPGSKYGQRMPIGKMEIVESFPYQALRDYYEKWYRPENQAIVVVGDIDPAAIQAQIKKMFGDIPRSEISAKSPIYPVPDNANLIVSVESDPELQNAMLSLYIKHNDLNPSDKATIDGLRENYIANIAAAMLADRYDEMENLPGASFSNLGTGDMKYIISRNPRAWLVRATVKPGRENDAAKDFVSEIKRAARDGFLPSEFERAKLDYKAQLDSRYANRDKIDNTQYARRFVKHFIEGGSIPAEEPYYKMMKGVQMSVKLEDVNKWFANLAGNAENNYVLMAYLPAKASGVDKKSLADAVASIDLNAIPAYIDKNIDRPILASQPTPGKVVKEENIDKFGAKLWTLSNGAKVYLHHNADKPDRIVIQAASPGGLSQAYNPAEAPSYLLINDVLATSAFGGHSSSDLRKLLVGKKADVKMAVEEMEDQMAVVTTPADLETAMQVIHLKATGIEKDTTAFATLIDNQRMKLSSHGSNPTFEMGDSIHAYVYNHHPLGMKIKLDDLDKVDNDLIVKIARDRFANMSDFSFFISGNFNEDSLRNFTEKYIASLPGNGTVEKRKDIGYRYAQGKTHRIFERDMETPASITYSLYSGTSPYNISNLVKAHALGQILGNKLREDIREEKGWTYGVKTHIGLNPGMNGDDAPQFLMPVYIRVEPGKEEECMAIVEETVKNLMQPGFITEEEVDKIKAYSLKNIDERDNDNAYWNSILKAYDKFGEDMHTDYVKEVEALSPASLTDYARSLFTSPNLCQLIMRPKK